MSPQFWLNLQTRFDLEVAEENLADRLDQEVTRLKKNQIIIRSAKNVREGWNAAFKAIGEKGDDEPIIDDGMSNVWDEEEWQW